MRNKRGQVTIFIIIAIVLVIAIAGFFLFRGKVSLGGVPANLEPAYNGFLSCIEEDVLTGVSVLEAQGGYIDLPEFESGNAYMPFSSQLNFLGNPIPYWYYISGNNIQKEQVPSKADMESELKNFLEQEISNCVLDEYYEQGYTIIQGSNPNADVSINKGDIEVNINLGLRIEKAEDSALVNNHKVIVDSKLGELYASAREIYDYEQKNLFLENYGIDSLRLYSPVDGVEITCSPMVWSADEVFDELGTAIEANVLSLKTENSDLSLRSKEDEYFIVDVPVKENVRFLTSSEWDGWSFEVNPTEGSVMMAKPVGNQPGLSALGFCYVPYHFVYNVNYPVLIQIYSDSAEEVFQFPFAVVIQGNKPREALDSLGSQMPDPELCKYKTTEMIVNTYDNYLRPVQSEIYFECLGQTCDIGETDGTGTLVNLFPECVNGFVVAKAEGYQTTKQQIESSAQKTNVDVLMNKVYEKNINLVLDGVDYTGDAVVSFISNSSSGTLIYPEQKTVELSQGQYEIQVYIYKDSEIKLEESSSQYCVEVPQTGIGTVFGLTDEECYDIEIPAQIITNALYGGGTQNYFMTESELQSGNIIDINTKSLPVPGKIEDVQENYILFENQGLDLMFR